MTSPSTSVLHAPSTYEEFGFVDFGHDLLSCQGFSGGGCVFPGVGGDVGVESTWVGIVGGRAFHGRGEAEGDGVPHVGGVRCGHVTVLLHVHDLTVGVWILSVVGVSFSGGKGDGSLALEVDGILDCGDGGVT